MLATTWEMLEADFKEFPTMRAEAVSRSEVDAAASKLGCRFDPDYSEFVSRYGGAMVGPVPILGVRRASVMGVDSWSVVEVTERYRRDAWRGADQWYVVSIDLAGNPLGMDDQGAVWLSDHDAGEIVRLNNTFEDFVLACLRGRAGA